MRLYIYTVIQINMHAVREAGKHDNTQVVSAHK